MDKTLWARGSAASLLAVLLFAAHAPAQALEPEGGVLLEYMPDDDLVARSGDAEAPGSEAGRFGASSSSKLPEEAVLSRSFPLHGRTLRFPPREARFSFSAPIDSSAFSVVLAEDGAREPLQRLTSGSTSDVLVRIPVLGPGEYVLEWSLSSGSYDSGAVRFSVAESLVAPGGGNHRHSTDDLFLESFASWFPRAALLAVSGVLLGVWRSSRRRERPIFADVAIIRAAGVALSLFSLVGVAVSAVEGLVRFGSHPLFSVLASDGVWVYMLALTLGAAIGITGKPGPALVLAPAALSLLVWSAGPAVQFRYGPAVPLLSLILYSLVVLFASELLMAFRGESPRWRAVLVLALVALSSAMLLFATAQTFSVLGEFSWDWGWRWRGILGASVAALLWWRVRPASILLRVAVSVPVLVFAMLAVWTPPPAPGL